MTNEHYIEVDALGRIVAGGCGVIPAGAPLSTGATKRVVLEANAPNPDTHYWSGSAVLAMPTRPSAYHDFDYASKTWVMNNEKAWQSVRNLRDERLAATDWAALRAADQGAPVPPEWLAYRQALRDVTTQPDPCSINWPEPPLSA